MTPSVSATLIQNGDTVLLLRRGATSFWMPGRWNFPMGHLEDGETALQAAAREAQEESGLVVTNLRLVVVSDPVAYFHTTSFTGDVQINWESDDWRWVPISEMANYNILPGMDQALAATKMGHMASTMRTASITQRLAARYKAAMRRPTKLKDLPTSRLSGRPEVVLAPDLKPGMRLAYHKWMARTRLTQFPNRWFDMVIEAVDVQGKSVVVTWSGKFVTHENADFYDPREPISVGKDRNRLRLDSKVNVLL